MNLSKYSGYSLIAIALLHTSIGLILGWPVLVSMHQDGWLASTMVNNQLDMSREAITWFLLSGYFWLLLGALMNTLIKHEIAIPRYLGWHFIVVAGVMCIIMPMSGAYLFILLGLMVLYGQNKTIENQTTIQN